jgi:DNA primase
MTTGQIPREFIQQLLGRVDIVDLIDGRVPLRKKSNNNFFACCPFHAEKSASFSVSHVKQFYYCFGCGAHGNAIDFLIQYDRLSFPEAIEALAKHAGIEVPREATAINAKPAIDNALYTLLANIAKYYQTELRKSQPSIDYLKHRGVSGEIAKDFGLGYAPAGWDHVLQAFGTSPLLKQQLAEAGMLIKKDEGGYYDRFRERIMFPIQDRRGRIIGFGGRILDKGDPKYLNSPETPVFQKGHELYGLYQALQVNRQLERAILVEGYMDVIALFQHGITYAVATLGTATTVHHLNRLFRYTTDIVFCFDGDQAGRTAAWRALLVTLPIMRDDLQIRFMFLPDGEDPDSLVRKEGKETFEQRIQAAPTLSNFFFQTLHAQSDLTSMDGRARFVKLATEHLSQLPPGIFQQMMYEELAKRARTEIAQLQLPKTSHAANPQKAKSPSALRLAITLLVQQPKLADCIHEPLPAMPDVPGFALLAELITTIKNNAAYTTGAILEYWRERREGQLLAKLAHAEHMIPAAGIEHEFIGTLKRIKKLASEQLIDKLLAKAAQAELSAEEKQHLHQLIHAKK